MKRTKQSKRTKKNSSHYISLCGVILFALLTIFIMLTPFLLSKQLLGETSITGFDFLSGDHNEINGIKVNCTAFIIMTIILSILVIIASVMRAINIKPKYKKFISSAVISAVSILLMICVIIFFVKLGEFTKPIAIINLVTCNYGFGAILYLTFGILTAISAGSLFFTDK